MYRETTLARVSLRFDGSTYRADPEWSRFEGTVERAGSGEVRLRFPAPLPVDFEVYGARRVALTPDRRTLTVGRYESGRWAVAEDGDLTVEIVEGAFD